MFERNLNSTYSVIQKMLKPLHFIPSLLIMQNTFCSRAHRVYYHMPI